MNKRFRNSRMTKTIAGTIGLLMAVMMLGGAAVAPAQAQTAESLAAQIQSLLATITALQAQLAVLSGGSTGTCSYTFTQNLTMESTGAEVLNLQKFLNNAGNQVAASGAGSPGNETSYFGGLTKAAVTAWQNANAASVLAPVGLSAGTGFWGPSSRAYANSVCTGTGTGSGSGTGTGTGTGTGVTVTSAVQPANSLAVQGAARVPFTTFTVTNNSGTAQTINSVTVERAGLANKAVFSGVVLLKGDGTQLGNSKTLNSNYQATVGEDVVIQSGSSMTFTVAGNMAASLASYAGEVGGLNVVAINTSAAVSGSLPITGASHTMNATLSIGTASLNVSSFDPNSAQTKEIGTTGVRFAGIRVTAGSGEDIRVRSMRWNQIGSAGSSDIGNLVMVVDGTEYPVTVSTDGNYYSSNFGSGIVIPKGNNIDIYLKGDINGGTNRTVIFDIEKTTDFYATGELYGYGVTPTAGATGAEATTTSTFSTDGAPFFDGSQLTINAGTATTITKSATVASQNVAVNVPDQPLGAFETDFKGEAVTVSGMTLTVASTTGSGQGLLTNVSIFDQNGNVVAGPIDATYTSALVQTLTFTDSVTIPVGKMVYTVKGKVGSNVGDGGTYIVTVTPSGWTTPVGDITGDTVSLSAFGAFTLNTMTIEAAALAISISASPAAQTIVAGVQGFIFANYQFDATQSGEDIRFSSMVADLESSGGAAGAYNNLTACQLFDGATALNTGSNVVNPSGTATTSDQANTFTLDNSLTIPKGTVKTLALKCNLSSSSDSVSTYQWGVRNTAANIVVTGTVSSNAVTETVTASNGQVMTVGTGTLVATTDAGSPAYKIAAAGTAGVTLGKYKLSSTNEAITIQRVGIGLGTITASSTASDLTAVTLWVSGSQVGSATFVGTNRNATSTLTTAVVVPKDGSVVIEVRGDLASQGASQASNNGALLTVDIDTNSTNTQGVGSSGTIVNASGTTSVAGVRVMRSYPTVAQQTSGMSSTLVAQSGTDLYKFSISANSAGDVALNELTINVATSSLSTTNGTTTVKNLKVYAYTDSAFSNVVAGSSFTDGQINTTTATILNGGDNVEALVAVLTIPAGQTYYFKVVGDVAQVAGTTGSAGTVSTKIVGDSAYPSLNAVLLSQYATALGNFVWSPLSTTTSASADNADWTNGYQVPGLPSSGTNAFTLTK